ncbi:MAG: nucleotidyltransferase family protein [Gemmatimonadetes bacterium]|nr:nucleotidyltransferase family protein [Gemmatimonadota bacterium]
MRTAPDAETRARRAEVLALLGATGPFPLPAGASADAWDARLETLGAPLHPWLAHRLAALGMEQDLPAGTRARLRASLQASAVAELRRRSALIEIVEAFGAGGIPFVLLKGMALAHTHYPAPQLRTMSDIDIWLQPERCADAVALLGRSGWRIPGRYATHVRAPADALLLERPDAPFVLEVHTWPPSLGRDSTASERIWARCDHATIAGRQVRVCSTRDLVAHLCLHLTRKHGCSDGLRGLVDLACVARHIPDDPTWRALGAWHRDDGVALWTSFALAMARDLVGAPVPASYFAAAGAPPVPETLRSLALEQLWDHEPTTMRGVEGMLAGELGGPLHALRNYVRDFYAAPGADGRRWWRALPSRLRFDLTVRIPRYWRALRRGELRRTRLSRRATMIQDRHALIDGLKALAPTLSEGPPAPSAPR